MSQHIGYGLNWVYNHVTRVPSFVSDLIQLRRESSHSRSSRRLRSMETHHHPSSITSSSSSPPSVMRQIPPPHSHRHNRALQSPRIESDHNEKDRNVIAAMMSIIVIASLATALAQPKWFSVNGGFCNHKYIGLQQFNNGKDIENAIEPNDFNRIKPASRDNVNCVTPQIINSQRTIIALCFFAIMSHLIQFFLDTIGTRKKWANTMRLHAIGNIFGVLLCVIIIGVSYLVSNLLEKEQQRIANLNPNHNHTHIEVKFELSYYLVTLSGLLGIVAAACNLLKKRNHYFIDSNDQLWCDNNDAILTPLDDELSASSLTNSPLWRPLLTHPHMTLSLPIVNPQQSSMPPPPPYTP